MPKLQKIAVYPIKALDPVFVDEIEVLPNGALKYDRAWAMQDASGNFINGKRNAKVHQLRTTYDLLNETVSFSSAKGNLPALSLREDSSQIEAWLSDFFEEPVKLISNEVGGFPDDTELPGPTVIASATLQEIANWFPGLDSQNVFLRFRANLIIESDEPFWEDKLYAEKDVPVTFQIGEIAFEGLNPCQRCNVPARDPQSGEQLKSFQKEFIRKREETLPTWANRDRFDHFYRITVNTRLPKGNQKKSFRVGDQVKIY